MKIIVRERLKVCTIGEINDLVSIEPGVYEIEEIDNPFGIPDARWYLFKELNAGGSTRYFDNHLSCTIGD